jgi:hypothetical protein
MKKIKVPKKISLTDKRKNIGFAAACPKCGGWTQYGGMSQYYDTPMGCKCRYGSLNRMKRRTGLDKL